MNDKNTAPQSQDEDAVFSARVRFDLSTINHEVLEYERTHQPCYISLLALLPPWEAARILDSGDRHLIEQYTCYGYRIVAE